MEFEHVMSRWSSLLALVSRHRSTRCDSHEIVDSLSTNQQKKPYFILKPSSRRFNSLVFLLLVVSRRRR